MRLKHLLAGMLAAVLMVAQAGAAAPPSKPGYQINVTVSPYVAPNFAPSQVPMWLDTTTTLTNLDGSTFALPRPVSDQSPLPVNCITGCGGGTGGGSAAVTRSAPSQPANVPVGSSPTTIIPASTSYAAIRYYVQGASGTGNSGCATWGPVAPSISGNLCVNGFPIFPGSLEKRTVADGAMPTTPLVAIGASGSALTITYEVQ